MNKQEFLTSAGIWSQENQVGLWQWRLSSEVQPRIRRFKTFIEEVLHSPLAGSSKLGACLVGLDGISPQALVEIERQGVVPYLDQDKVMLEWEELTPPHTEKRVLFPLTAGLWPMVADDSGVIRHMAPNDLVSGLTDHLAKCTTYSRLADKTVELARDALCWWYQALPAPHFAHLAGMQVMSALPRSALGRRCKRLAVIHPATEGQDLDVVESDLGFTAEMLDCAMSSDGSDESPVILEQGVSMLDISAQEVDGVTKRRWAQWLFDLQSRAQAAGPITSLLLAWGIDLCENGTSGQSNLARSTVSHYFRQAALPLFKSLRLMKQMGRSGEWKTEEMHAIYLTLISAQSIGNKRTMASALTSFHNFLSECFDLEPMALRLHGEVPLARVHAQVIWVHEIDLTMSWLILVDDERVRTAAMIMLGVASEVPSRTTELMRQRLANIREGVDELGPMMEIEIARHAIIGRLKTHAAQRRLTIRNPATMDLIRHWIATRTKEGAPLTSYLFGDPNNDSRLYRPGAVVSLLNRLLKAATGEPGARIHWLRHGAINADVGGHLNSGSMTDLNRISVSATGAGHVSSGSTFRIYFHLYESSLRTYLNAALELIKLTSAQAAPHLQQKSNTVRQRASRNSMKIEDYIWSQLRQIPIIQPFPDVAEPFGWQKAVMPKLLPHANLTVTVAVARNWLEKLLDGVGTQTLALRFGTAPEILDQMTKDTMSFSRHLACSAWPRRFTVRSLPPADLKHALEMAKIDLARAQQPKFKRLEDWFSTERPRQVLRDAHASWQACRKGDYLALDTSGQVLDLYLLLASAKVDPLDLRLCIHASLDTAGRPLPLPAGQRTHQELARASAIEDFMAVFGVAPRETLQQARADRPDVYLQWDDPAHRQVPTSGSSSCAGLDSWMCAVAALLSIKDVQS